MDIRENLGSSEYDGHLNFKEPKGASEKFLDFLEHPPSQSRALALF